jgi:hypothetical protein
MKVMIMPRVLAHDGKSSSKLAIVFLKVFYSLFFHILDYFLVPVL